MVNISLEGIPEVVNGMIEQLRNKGFNIVSVSETYKDKRTGRIMVGVKILLGGYTL